MMDIYEEYLFLPGNLTLEEMTALHKDMAEEIRGDAEAFDLYKELYTAAMRYSESRAGWSLWDKEKKQEEDPARTSRHNKVIIAFNILARYLRNQGKSASWRDVLGDENKDPGCRKRIGDFACFLVFIESLNAR